MEVEVAAEDERPCWTGLTAFMGNWSLDLAGAFKPGIKKDYLVKEWGEMGRLNGGLVDREGGSLWLYGFRYVEY